MALMDLARLVKLLTCSALLSMISLLSGQVLADTNNIPISAKIFPVIDLLLSDSQTTPPPQPISGLAIGIPAPTFGITDSHQQYAGQLFEAGGFVYRDAGNGPYTHYVDNTAANCDDNNAGGYGTATEPLCSITRFGNFTDLPEGSVMEIHGGPYNFNPGWTRMVLRGSQSKPVFVRGVNAANGDQVRLQRNLTGSSSIVNLRLEGQYYLFENLDLYRGVYPQIRQEILSDPHHIAFRDLEVHGDPAHQVAAGVALSSGVADDVVIYNNHIHHNIRLNNADLHGTSAGAGSERVWILNNHIHHNSGDAFQACHFCSVDQGSTPPRFIYIGGNVMHEDRENGVDLKTIRDVIVSQNRIYGYRSSATSGGDAVVVGSNGVSPTLDGIGPDNAWFLFNEIYDSGNGVRFEGVFGGTFIGNYIRDNNRHGIALDIKANSRQVRLVNNTIAHNNEGLHQHWQCHDPLELDVANNVFYNHAYFQIGVGGCIAGRTALNNNVFWQDGDPIYFVQGYNTYNSGSGPRTEQEALAEAQSRRFIATGNMIGSLNAQGLAFTGNGNFSADPLFESPDNLRLQAGSAALDRTAAHPVYQEFMDLYGVDIRFDFDGNPRPTGTLWDLGAFERVVAP